MSAVTKQYEIAKSRKYFFISLVNETRPEGGMITGERNSECLLAITFWDLKALIHLAADKL